MALSCPRCTTLLEAVSVGSASVAVCPKCEGAWYPGEALAEVTDQTFGQLKASELGSSMVPDKLGLVNTDNPIACPECDVAMKRYTYSSVCPIVLDECPEHGVWLDDGELGTLMQFLTHLEQKVGQFEQAVLAASNIQQLKEMSKRPEGILFSSQVLGTLGSVHNCRP